MKLLIAAPYFSPKVGGLENYALCSAQEFRRQGHEVVVVAANHAGRFRSEDFINGLRVIRLPYLAKFSNTPLHPAWPLWLKRIIKSERPDAIITHTPVPSMSDSALLVAGRGVPVFVTYHAATFYKKGSPVFNSIAALYRIYELLLLRRATGILPVSEYVKSCLPKPLQSKAVVAPNAIDVIEQPNRAKKIKNTFIFIGNLHKTHAWKGLGNIICALAIARRHGRDIELIVLGDGDMKDTYMMQATKAGVESAVHFKGNVEGKEKFVLLQKAVALVAYPTTENDAFPTVFLEAWASRTPVIAADIGALSSLITNRINGLLVAPAKPDELALALEAILDDELLAQKIANYAVKDVRQAYTWQQTAKTTLQFITEKSAL